MLGYFISTFGTPSHIVPHPESEIGKMFSIIFSIALSLVGPSLCAPADPVFKLTDADFDHFLKDKDTMLVDFYAPW